MNAFKKWAKSHEEREQTPLEWMEEAYKAGYKQGLADGATKQAILELRGRGRFLEGLADRTESP